MTSRLFGALGMAGALLLGATSAQAVTTVYSDFGTHFGFTFNALDILGGGSIGYSQTEASYFETGAVGGTLDYIDVAIERFGGLASGTAVSVALVPVNPGTGYPGLAAPFEEWIVYKTPVSRKNHLVSKLHPTLTPNTFYWVVVSAIGYDTFYGAFDNSTGATNGYVSTDGGHSWIVHGPSIAMDIVVE